jgi:hypothetical protein
MKMTKMKMESPKGKASMTKMKVKGKGGKKSC